MSLRSILRNFLNAQEEDHTERAKEQALEELARAYVSQTKRIHELEPLVKEGRKLLKDLYGEKRCIDCGGLISHSTECSYSWCKMKYEVENIEAWLARAKKAMEHK